MKALLVPLAACALLAGCATYGDPYYYGNYGTYGTYGYGAAYPSTVYTHPSTVYTHPTYTVPGYYGGHVYRSYPAPGYRVERDRDRDGVPNRVDPDRDGDGVPNQYDRRPNNPRLR